MFVARAPGRVNLIGEHTDYNDGFVLPMAIERDVRIAVHPRDDRLINVYSRDYDEHAEFELDDIERGQHSWAEYVKGVAWMLREDGRELRGWNGIISGDVPRAAGLSSSAAIELATLRAFAFTSSMQWRPVEAALLGQRVEHEWIGVNCGIMDQLVVACAQAGHALLIDCRSLETQPVPLPSNVAVVILDTNTRRGLVESAYNERRISCERAATTLGVKALRDVDSERLRREASKLDASALRRARHVVTENERTLAAADALHRSDTESFGRLMDESHTSLRDDFEVSSIALDTIVSIAREQAGCFGARMTGAGFGGCAVALVQNENIDAFTTDVAKKYKAATGLAAQVFTTRAANGTSLETFNESART